MDPQTPPKTGMSTGVILGIVGGATLLIVAILIGVLVALVATTEGGNTARGDTNDTSLRGSTDVENDDSDFNDLATYKTNSFLFRYPSAWKEKDLSNQTTIIGGTVPDGQAVITSSSSDSEVIVEYTYNKGSATKVDKEKARSAMKTALETQRGATPAQLQYYRESSGHGCAQDAQYTSQPVYMEKGDLIGYVYGYKCISYYGPVEGVYGVWYDAYGAQHRLLVSSLEEYWSENETGLQAILNSAQAL